MAVVRRFSIQQNIVIKIVDTFGCADRRQFYYLFDNLEPEFIDEKIIKFLIVRGYISALDDKYLIRANNGSLNMSTINCLWAACLLIKKTSKTPINDIDNLIPATPPAEIYLTINNQQLYEIMPVDKNSLIKLRTMQEMINQRNEILKTLNSIQNYFVITTNDKEVIQAIKPFQYKLNILIYLINDNGEKFPEFKTYKKSAHVEES